MPRALHNLTNCGGGVTLCVLVTFAAGCDVEAPETGAPQRIAGLTTPPLLTGPQIDAATRTASPEAPAVAARAAALQARASALQGAVLDPDDSARLLAPQARP